jgi:hypothetical protein
VRCGEWIVFPLAMSGVCLVFLAVVLHEAGQDTWIQLSTGCIGVGIIAFSALLAILMRCTSVDVATKASIHTFELYRCAFRTLLV